MYYKVVREDFNKLVSVCSNQDFPDRFRVIYKPKIWTPPSIKDTKLFCFDCKDNACQFILYNSEIPFLRLYCCEVKNPRVCEQIAYPEDIERFWSKEETVLMRAPPGTIACDAIRLTVEASDAL